MFNDKKEDLRIFRETDTEIVYNKKSLSFWGKIKFTFKIWLGFKVKLKVKVRVPISGDEVL